MVSYGNADAGVGVVAGLDVTGVNRVPYFNLFAGYQDLGFRGVPRVSHFFWS